MKHDIALSRKPSLKEIAHATGGEISGAQVLAPGPGHSAHDRSLSIKMSATDPDGYVVYSHSPRTTHLEGKDYVRERLGQPRWEPRNGKTWDPVIAEYIYKQRDSTLYFRVQRTASKKFWQQHWTGSEWQNGAPKGPRIPYRLPELLSAEPAQPIYIVEGEKDADRLASLGFIATTSSGGSNGKWTPELNAAFANRTVYIIPDNDEPGDKYAQRVAQHLSGVASRVSIVELPGLGPRTSDHGKDVSDWLDLGNLPDNLEHIAKSAPVWTPPVPQDGWRSHVFTAASLKDKKFDPIYYVVPTLFPEGLTILAGRPKVGKSWMALDIALGLAGGYYILGAIKLEPADVLYCALEDNPRRLRSRIDRILAGSGQLWPERLTLATKWRRLDAGGVADAKEWVAGVKRPKLIIFDTLAGVRPDRNNKDNLYEGDYRALTELQSWTNEAGIGAMILHHTRKMEADDPIDSVSGTLGLTGCVDTVSVLARTPKGTTLYIRGRDVEEQEKAITFSKASCRWSIQGDAEEVHQHDTRKKIVTVLREASQPLSPSEIAEMSDIRSDNVRQTVTRMVADGEIVNVSKGRYVHPDRLDLIPVNPCHRSHKSQKSRLSDK